MDSQHTYCICVLAQAYIAKYKGDFVPLSTAKVEDFQTHDEAVLSAYGMLMFEPQTGKQNLHVVL